MTRVFLFLLVFCAGSAASAQYRKAVYAGFMGAAPHGSVNYDMRLQPDRNDGLGFNIGLSGSSSYFGRKDISLGIPVGVNYLVGKNRHALELGLSAVPQFNLKKSETPKGGEVSVKDKSVFVHGHINIGYRLQPIKDKGLFVKVQWTPPISFRKDHFYSYNNRGAFLLSNIGLGVGYSFK